MHEFGIAEELIGLVEHSVEANSGVRATRVIVEVGAGALEPETMRVAFEMAKHHTAAEGAELVIETAPVEFHCFDCAAIFNDADSAATSCPVCGSNNTMSLPNHDVILKSVEIEG